MRRWRRESALDIYNLVAAAVLFLAPWLFSLTNGAARLDFWLGALAIVTLSTAAMFAYANWEEWANVLVGLWLIASPWLLGFAHLRAMPFAVGVGAIVIFMAMPGLWLVYDDNSAHQTPPGRI